MKFTRYEIQGVPSKTPDAPWQTLGPAAEFNQLGPAESFYVTVLQERTDLAAVRIRKVEVQEKYTTIREYETPSFLFHPRKPLVIERTHDPDGSVAYVENWYCTPPPADVMYKVTQQQWRISEGMPPERDIFSVEFPGQNHL